MEKDVMVPEQPVKRRRGRPPKVRPVEAAAPAVAVAPAPVEDAAPQMPSIPDDELELYGGDIAALESWSPKCGRPFPTYRSYDPTGSLLPSTSSKGMLVYKHDPSQLFHFGKWDDDGSPYSRTVFMSMKARGYRPATPEDFIVHPTLRDIILPDDKGRLAFGTLRDSTTVVMVQSAADYHRDREYLLRQSNNIQKTAEEKAATLEEELLRSGMTGARASSVMEDDYDAAREFNR